MAKLPSPQVGSGDDAGAGKRRRASAFSTILLGLIAVSMLGFGVTSFGGGTQRIGTVGDQEITVNDYVNALQAEVSRYSQLVGTRVALGDLLAAGVSAQVLAALVRSAALDGEMAEIGLSVGDTELAAELVKIAAFQGLDGQFDRAAYGETLRRNDLTEAAFEANLRADIARGLLQGAVTGGAAAPPALVNTVLAYSGELRALSYISLSEGDLPAPLPAPTQAELQAEYDANITLYTRPEAKRIDYVALLPADIAADLPVDEAAIAALYNERIDQYVIPEKRLVERLVYPSVEAAAEARAQLDAGTSFEDLVTARGLSLLDIDMGDVAQGDLGAAGAAVFALTEPGVVGPVDSDLGPALIRMNAILAAQETKLDDVREELARELALQDARGVIADRVDAIDDALAGGATLAELAQAEGLTLARTDYAKGAADNDAIAGYAAFVEAADVLELGDFPQAILLEDGGVVAMSLVEIVPPTPRPLADVQDEVTANWRTAALGAALAALADDKLAALNGGADIASLGAVQTANIGRDGAISGAPSALIASAFEAEAAGAAAVVSAGDFVALMRLDAITPASENPESGDLRAALESQLRQSLAADVLDLYGRSIETAAGISLDQGVITSVHTQMGN